MDGSDEEAEADEDLDHLGSVEAVPRSDAEHLKQLDSLGITNQNEIGDIGVDILEEVGSEKLADVSSDETQKLKLLRGGPSWFKESLSDGDRIHGVIHGMINAMRQNFVAELNDRVISIPEDFEEEENLDSLEMSWTTHSSHRSFSHHTVRPSFVQSSAQSFHPSMKSWTFTHQLDPVQTRAIACVENGESVLVCAPTSAGKTAVATYAVAMALHAKRRAIYTTPIKALSNQKFLELGKSFGGQYVGILTGDTVIASDAPIVVMTLEILQSMLYKQARDPNLLDDFQCVVIDEAHFLGDLDRGYAWEEVLILLPSHVKLVLLSATVPNSQTIADWCARVRLQPMHVITSEQRPVPCEQQH